MKNPNDTHKMIAQNLKMTRDSKYHVYPNSGTVRSQAIAMIKDLQSILNTVPEGVDVPPWVVMKISQCKESIDAVNTYISYYGNRK
jgi:hypothetical protein